MYNSIEKLLQGIINVVIRDKAFEYANGILPKICKKGDELC